MMKTRRTLFLAVALAAFGAPALADNRPATATPSVPAMNELQPMMRTMAADPVISKRMNELMAANPKFKRRFEQLWTLMSPGMMGNRMGAPSSMSSSPGPKP